VLATKWQHFWVAVPVHRRSSVGCGIWISDGDRIGAGLPLVKIVAALLGRSALGWLLADP
jgi:hypothetical protein